MKPMEGIFATATEYEQYLATLSERQQLMSVAHSQLVDISIVFGLLEKDRVHFTAHTCQLIDWIHEGYQSGTWRPGRGSGAQFFVNIVEHYAGGRPRPEHREVLIRKCFAHCLNMLKPKGPLVPRSSMDPKRDKAIEDLERIQREEEEKKREDTDD